MDRDRYRRDEVAVIYQTFNLFPMLNVLENVMYPLQLRGIGGQQAKEMCIRDRYGYRHSL